MYVQRHRSVSLANVRAGLGVPGLPETSHRPRRLAAFRRIATGEALQLFRQQDYFVLAIIRATLLLFCTAPKKHGITFKTAG
jgi:hypothetical protein